MSDLSARCFLSALDAVRSAETLPHARFLARAVVPTMLAFGSASPDNWACARRLVYARAEGRFELRIQRTGAPIAKVIARAGAKRPGIAALVALLERTGTAGRERGTRLLLPLPGLAAARKLAVAIEGRAEGDLAVAARAAVLVVSALEAGGHRALPDSPSLGVPARRPRRQPRETRVAR